MNFIITMDDSLFRGKVRILRDGSKGRKYEILDIYSRDIKLFHDDDIRYYSYKQDTFVFLRNFYPFEGEDYPIESIEAKVLISKGAIKVYQAGLPKYMDEVYSIPTGTDGSAMFVKSEFVTYILKDKENNLIALKKERKDFEKTLEYVIGDDNDLMNRVKRGEFRFKDTPDIISLYNKRLTSVDKRE